MKFQTLAIVPLFCLPLAAASINAVCPSPSIQTSGSCSGDPGTLIATTSSEIVGAGGVVTGSGDIISAPTTIGTLTSAIYRNTEANGLPGTVSAYYQVVLDSGLAAFNGSVDQMSIVNKGSSLSLSNNGPYATGYRTDSVGNSFVSSDRTGTAYYANYSVFSTMYGGASALGAGQTSATTAVADVSNWYNTQAYGFVYFQFTGSDGNRYDGVANAVGTVLIPAEAPEPGTIGLLAATIGLLGVYRLFTCRCRASISL